MAAGAAASDEGLVLVRLSASSLLWVVAPGVGLTRGPFAVRPRI